MTAETVLGNIAENWPEARSAQSRAVVLAFRYSTLLRVNAEGALAPFELSFSAFEILAALRASPPPHALYPSALYDVLLLSSGGVTKLLKGLEDRGLVTRPANRGEDRRRRPIALTAKGRDLAEKAMAAVQAADAARATLTDTEFDRLSRLLEKALKGLEGAA